MSVKESGQRIEVALSSQLAVSGRSGLAFVGERDSGGESGGDGGE